jgi:glycosyltransferase involved in cell wall biosynthesis
MLSDVYFPRVNGVSTSIKTFRRCLTDLSHEVFLIAPAYGPHDEKDERLFRIPSRYLLIDPEDRILRKKEVLRLQNTLAELAIDIVHIQTPFIAHYSGLKLARLLDVPCVETYHTHFEEYLYHYLPLLPKSIVRTVTRWFTRQQCSEVDALIVPSQAMLEVAKEYRVNTPIEIIPTGIEERFFNGCDKTHFRTQHGIGEDRPVLMHIGRVAHEKNIGFLLEVLALVRQTIPDVLLVIAGQGPALGALKKQGKTQNLQHNLLFVGYQEREKALLDCYCAGDVFVFASRTETQGLVLLEAMALGVPVVSTAMMGTKDILQPGKGALIAQEEPNDFAGKVIELLRNPQLREQLAQEGRAYGRSWSPQTMARKMVSCYQNVLAARHPMN